MEIRAYEVSDAAETAALFYDTVHRINARDYTADQLAVWAPKQRDLRQWAVSFEKRVSLVAVINGQIVGFGDMTTTGYLDRLYVHADYQRQGIATALCDALENVISAPAFTTYASITAQGFFLQRGYAVVRQNIVTRGGVQLANILMRKELM